MHEMIEIKHWFKDNIKNSCSLEVSWFFHLYTILRNVHVVSANNNYNELNKNKFFYINNFSNWDLYNSIYKKNFLHKEIIIIIIIIINSYILVTLIKLIHERNFMLCVSSEQNSLK